MKKKIINIIYDTIDEVNKENQRPYIYLNKVVPQNL